MLSLIVFFESFDCTNSNAFSMTDRTFIEIFSHFFSDFLWLKCYRLYTFPTIPTEKSNLSAFKIEIIFTLFSKRGNIHEISIGSRQLSED